MVAGFSLEVFWAKGLAAGAVGRLQKEQMMPKPHYKLGFAFFAMSFLR